jgi:hypothetical protein
MRYRGANPIQRFLRWSAVTAPMSWLYPRVLHHINRLIYRLPTSPFRAGCRGSPWSC